MRQAYERVYEQFHFDYNFMGMEALIAAYDACEDFVEQQNRYFTENLSVVRDFLRCEMPELRLIEPEGTYLLWLDCRAWGLKQPELMARFAGWGVGLNDGSMYGPGGEGFVGNNGTGKSTFIKILMGDEKADSGTLDIGETVRFGYYSQDGLQFDEQMKVIDVVQDIAEVIELGNGKRLTASQFLQHFLFTPETQHSYVYKLSGGERRRLYLCTVLMRNPNFLVLDEPTNDLDIVTLNVLEEYLQNFKGCVIVVSHDRYFMDKVVDHLLVFNGQGDIRDFPGNYTQYRDWKDVKAVREKEKEKEAAKDREEKTAKVRLNEKRRMSFKEKREFELLEQEIAALEAEKQSIEEALCSGTLSVDELTEKSKRLPELAELIDEKTMRWLELSEIESN